MPRRVSRENFTGVSSPALWLGVFFEDMAVTLSVVSVQAARASVEPDQPTESWVEAKQVGPSVPVLSARRFEQRNPPQFQQRHRLRHRLSVLLLRRSSQLQLR